MMRDGLKLDARITLYPDGVWRITAEAQEGDRDMQQFLVALGGKKLNARVMGALVVVEVDIGPIALSREGPGDWPGQWPDQPDRRPENT